MTLHIEETAPSASVLDPAGSPLRDHALATRLFVLHEGAVATGPLAPGTVAAAADLARELVRAAVRG